ncbi:MAG TPA: dihydroxyacetone kinase subunit DhaL [Spirochaetia bacterium]|nr:dihydroxyacetone kinase subunit DhaL [Spirochaetia bacterium]
MTVPVTPMDSFLNQDGFPVIQAVIGAIRDNAALLSEIDGALGDGDHGINMAKGFAMAAQKLPGPECTLADGLSTIGTVLLTEIGGAMGPLYGTFFRSMGRECRGVECITAETFESMLKKALEGVVSLGGAKVGDKTMLDTLSPALDAFARCRSDGLDFAECLCVMMKAAEEGKDSTRDLVARLGRASRLGERSRGNLDAGAVSCWLILGAVGGAMMDVMGSRRACQDPL